MTPNPILKVLSTMRQHHVQYLLIGGQACVLYGAAEFSRDTDIAVLSSSDNLDRLQKALDDLEAHVIAVPPFESKYLDRGHAVHFRCQRDDVNGMRIDVMSKLRGVDPFPSIWDRRSTIELPEGEVLDVLSLHDLVASKKTQRDKDWPMLRRLLEADYSAFRERASDTQITFWLRELRTAAFLIDCAAEFAEPAEAIANERPAVRAALEEDVDGIEAALKNEEETQREADQVYWNPLKEELERLRREFRKASS